MKSFIYSFLLIWMCVLVSGCTNGADVLQDDTDIPSLRLRVGENDLSDHVYRRQTDESSRDDVTSFKHLFEEKNIEYVPLGSKISFEFTDVPSSVVLKDIILNHDGSIKYDGNTVKSIDLESLEESYTFILDGNYHVALSSNSEDYNTVYRGLKCTAHFGESVEMYYFVFETESFYK